MERKMNSKKLISWSFLLLGLGLLCTSLAVMSHNNRIQVLEKTFQNLKLEFQIEKAATPTFLLEQR